MDDPEIVEQPILGDTTEDDVSETAIADNPEVVEEATEHSFSYIDNTADSIRNDDKDDKGRKETPTEDEEDEDEKENPNRCDKCDFVGKTDVGLKIHISAKHKERSIINNN